MLMFRLVPLLNKDVWKSIDMGSLYDGRSVSREVDCGRCAVNRAFDDYEEAITSAQIILRCPCS